MSLSSFARASSRALLTCLAGSALSLRAQTAPASAPPTRLAPVIVPGRGTDLLGVAASASQGIVGAPQLERRPFLRRGELLEVVPGVVVTQHSGNGKANQYFLRGFNLDHGTDFALTVDGQPVNQRSHAHGQGYADLNFVIPEAVRQIDYNKGPFFAEVGDFSAAGAAHFRQTDAFAHPFVSVTLGENRFARLVAGGTQPAPDGSLTGAFEASHDDGPWLLPEDGRRTNAYVRRHWIRPAADYRLTALAYHGRWRATDQIPLRAVTAGTLDRFGAVDDSDGGTGTRASLAFDARWRGADATTHADAYAIFSRLNLFSNFTYFLDDAVAGDQFNQRDRRWILGGSVTRTWIHASGPARGGTTFGLQTRLDLIDELGLHRTARRTRLATVRDDTVDQGSLGLFARHDTRWTDWLRSSAGLRVDGYRFAVRSDDPRNSGRARADIASPKLALAFGPWRTTEFYLNAGTGFHSNDARGTTLRVDPADGTTPAERVTPLARSRGAELGLRTTTLPGVVSTLSFWALNLDSELVFVGDAGGTEPAGRTRRRGVEWANFARLAPWCTADLDVAFTQARYRDDAGTGTRIANSIGTVITAGISLGRESGAFGGARFRYFGAHPLLEDNSVRAPASFLGHANLGWRTHSWECALELLNVFDRRDYDIAYFYASRLRGEPAGGRDDVHFHPTEPRTLRLTLTRRF
jgi:hypothetical protein